MQLGIAVATHVQLRKIPITTHSQLEKSQLQPTHN
jgi:hypothetical protein